LAEPEHDVMGIFDDGETKLIEETDSRVFVQRVSEDLHESVKRDRIALEIEGTKIKLLSQSRTTLEITCEATNAFWVMDDLGNHPSRFLTPAAKAAPRPGPGRRSCTQIEMTESVNTWLDKQRG
jgi:hypothetical protein